LIQIDKIMTDEIKDIIECIIKFDKTETLKNKGKYFEVIQKDLTDEIKKITWNT